ncbi:MAG: CPBP family intramembrane metalloprotease [Actinomycetota bacterium]|nr:CPBP family intramembrane metalloprotease [Actinomycetota bacterium]
MPNAFGLGEALAGLAAGFLLAELLAGAYASARHERSGTMSFGVEVASLAGLWIGLVAAAAVASRRSRPRDATGLARSFARDYGLALRPWPDVPMGIAVGAVAQYALVPLFELPLLPFVPHLFQRVGQPAVSETSTAAGAGLVLLGVLICLGSPVVEELYFRGLLLRALGGRAAGLGPRLGPAVSVAVVAVVFGLVHFEAIQLLALVGFGAVLGVLAWRTGRLGPGIVAHVTFNALAFVSVVRSR